MSNLNIIRVFPRRTRATPTDELAFIGDPPGLLIPPVDEIHVSCTFTWDKQEAERLASIWAPYGKVMLGGPAYDDPGDEFVPGRYFKPGYVITSRGCNNRCWFCHCWRREGKIRQLPITEGWNILDNNLLQCSESHIRAVFAMLKRQPRKAEFTGGLDAKELLGWHINLLADLKPKQIFFAYDTEDDWKPLVATACSLKDAGFKFHPHSHSLRCYVLVGHPHDSLTAAQKRIDKVIGLGLTPMAMLWRGDNTDHQSDWRKFQRKYARPQIIHALTLNPKAA